MDLDEAITIVITIGERYERQLRLAEEVARADRQRKISRKAQGSDAGS